MTRAFLTSILFALLIGLGCGNGDNHRDAAYFRANPAQLERYMATVEKNLSTLTEQVEKGHISMEEFETKRMAIIESPTYKAAREAARK